jgi:hypothetical protein
LENSAASKLMKYAKRVAVQVGRTHQEAQSEWGKLLSEEQEKSK